MTTSVSRVDPSELDFNQIRTALKGYLERSGVFTGYDFEGSTLGSLLDVLAYNTHLNALIANFSLNEAFLDSAQLRSSVVSLAKPLNYVPRSKSAARATVNVTISGTSLSGEYTLPKYTKFVGSINGQAYNFYTLDEYTANSGSNFVFEDVILYEGNLVTKRFVVDSEGSDYPIYVIPDDRLFTDSLQAVLRAGIQSTEITTLRRPSVITDFGPEEDIYLIAESANGYWEVTLGDGIVGTEPPKGSVLEITYLSTSGADANLIRSFTTTETVSGRTLACSTVAAASGGADKESISSIKYNAPRSYASQDRAITVDDYKALIQNAVAYVEAINVWGGQDASPPEYGAVYVAIKPLDSDVLSDERKLQLSETVLKGRTAIGTRILYADIEYQYLQLAIDVRYRPSQTARTKQQIENLVKDAVIEWGNDVLIDFGSTFRKSALTTFIDTLDPAITASDVSVRLQRRLVPTIGLLARYDLNFNASARSPVGSIERIIVSDEFQYEVDGIEYDCRIRNKLGSYDLEIYRQSGSGDIVVVDGVGTFDPATQILTLLPFGPSGLTNVSEGIRFTLTPADENVVLPKQNRLIRIDPLLTNVTASSDE